MKKIIIMFMLNDKEDGSYRQNDDLGYFRLKFLVMRKSFKEVIFSVDW